ncbi:Melanoma-associated antigen F1 [Mortierella sp. GBA30]|nr:Melanoma-associated antigen F1 [Mortierella sp. GBA30]
MDDEDYSTKSNGSSKTYGKRSAPSGSQGHSSGSQKRVMRDDDSDQDEGSNAPTPIRPTSSGTKQAFTSSSSQVNIDPEDFERLIKDVVRLAVFTSHSDSSLKREDIRNVLNDHSRLFDRVFEKAQERLRDVFGMEMVELTTKGRSGQSNEKGTKAYFLRNVLPQELLASHVVDWEPEFEDMGLLMITLALIMVRQGAILESVLMSRYRRLSLLEDASPFGEIQKKLDVYIKKRYLEKVKLDHMDETGEKVEMEYRWGARARVEIPEENVIKFIQEVFGREAPSNLEASVRKAAGMKGKEKANENEPAEMEPSQQ